MPTRLTYDQLQRISEPKRKTRAETVKGPPLDIDAYRDAIYYAFNFKSRPSTTGLRHRGYVKFFRPRNRQTKPLQHLQCMVDCTCPDYRYRWAWANKQRRSGAVGPQSLNQAWNRAPRRTNPKSVPGLCKHILAMRQYIYGLLSSFPSDQPDTSEKFDKLLAYATRRWADFPGAMAAARERDERARQQAHLRNVAGPPPPPVSTAAAGAPVQPPELPPEVEVPAPPEDELAALRRVAVPPAERGLGFPSVKPTVAPGGPVPTSAWPSLANVTVPPPPYTPSTRERTKGRIETGGFPTVAQRRAARYGESACVVTTNGETMSDLNQAIRIVEELEDEYANAEAPLSGGDMGGDMAAPDLPPSEPPISDTALGADTEGETALSLLSQMRDSLQQLATALAPPPEETAPEMGGEGALPPGAGEELPGEGEDDLGVPEPTEGAEKEEEEEEEEEEKEPPKGASRRPVGA